MRTVLDRREAEAARSDGPVARRAPAARAAIRYVSNSTLFSGAANAIHVMRMCEAFASNGHRVRLHCFVEPGSAVDPGEVWRRYGVGTPFALLPAPRPHGWPRRARYALHAVRAARADEIVYTRDFPTAVVCAAIGRRFVLESHAPMFGGALRRLLFARVFASPHLERFVVISQALADWYAAAGFASPRVRVAHDGASLPAAGGADAAARARLIRAGASLVVGYCGGLYAGKGVELLVEVARRMSNDPGVRFVIVGGDAAAVEHWRAAARGLANIVFLGAVEPAAVPSYIEAFDLCALPNQPRVATFGSGPGELQSSTDIGRFTSPLKMFEYMSHGKPILASDLAVLREVLDDRIAVLLPHDAPDAWAGAIRELLAAPERRRKLGEAAREQLVAHYTWTARAAHVLL